MTSRLDHHISSEPVLSLCYPSSRSCGAGYPDICKSCRKDQIYRHAQIDDHASRPPKGGSGFRWDIISDTVSMWIFGTTSKRWWLRD